MPVAPLALWISFGMFFDPTLLAAAASDSQPAKVEAKAAAAPVKPKPDLHPVEEQIIKLTNAERVRRGLPPLAVDQNLVKSARKHATWMTVHNTLQHTRQVVAENIAWGQSSSKEALRSWMNSSGHRANILSRGHRRIGVAAYVGRDGRIYWCQQFER